MSEPGLRRAVLALCVALCAALGLGAPAAAQTATPPAALTPLDAPLTYLALDTGTPGEAGPQLDAAHLSPQPLPGAQTAAAPRTYRVKLGDTLSGIATQLKVDPARLAAQNNIGDADRLTEGQMLRIGGETGAGSLRLPAGPLARVQFWPWPLQQGRTSVAWLRTGSPLSLTVTFAGQPLPVVADERGGWVLIPVGPLAEPHAYPLVVSGGAETVTLSLPVVEGIFETSVVPPETADPILGEAARVNAETERMTALFAGVGPFGWAPRARFQSPLTGQFPRTSPFGARRVYGTSTDPSVHTGEDFAADPGTPVLAPAAGVVALAEPLFVRGNAVVLDHGHGVFTGYWHMRALSVKAGDRVSVGQKLGEVGTTGMSTGPHLHWEMRVAGVAVDPLQWLARAPAGQAPAK